MNDYADVEESLKKKETPVHVKKNEPSVYERLYSSKRKS